MILGIFISSSCAIILIIISSTVLVFSLGLDNHTGKRKYGLKPSGIINSGKELSGEVFNRVGSSIYFQTY
jgi:hypothetical protein